MPPETATNMRYFKTLNPKNAALFTTLLLSLSGCDLFGGSQSIGGQQAFFVGAGEQWLTPGASGELRVRKLDELPPLRRHLSVVLLPGVQAGKDVVLVVDATGLKPGDKAVAWPMDIASYQRMVAQAPDPEALAAHVEAHARGVMAARLSAEYRDGRRKPKRAAKHARGEARSAIEIIALDRRAGRRSRGAQPRGDASGHAVSTTGQADLDAVVRETNARRARPQRCGKYGERPATAPLSPHAQLNAAAQAHAADMAAHKRMSHTGSDGSTAMQRARRAGFSGSGVGENVAMGQRSAREVVDGWVASEGHCKNMTDGRFTRIGVGVAQDARGVRYWAQVFGR